MDQEQLEYQRRRESSLSVMLAMLGLGAFLFFLALITGGFFLWVYLITAGIAGFAYLHYLLWGRHMMETTAGEREEEEFRARFEGNGWTEDDPRLPRHD
jgi:hypothetical protein